MTRLLDIRIQSSGQLDTLRRAEYLTLLLLCAVGLLLFPPYGIVMAGPFLLIAVMLVPREQGALRTHERQRREILRTQTLNELQSDGLALRAQWGAVAESPLSEQTAIERWSVQRDTTIWIATSAERLARFPEIKGIFEAHESNSDLLEELDDCLVTLSRMRRLVSLSERLNLRI